VSSEELVGMLLVLIIFAYLFSFGEPPEGGETDKGIPPAVSQAEWRPEEREIRGTTISKSSAARKSSIGPALAIAFGSIGLGFFLWLIVGVLTAGRDDYKVEQLTEICISCGKKIEGKIEGKICKNGHRVCADCIGSKALLHDVYDRVRICPSCLKPLRWYSKVKDIKTEKPVEVVTEKPIEVVTERSQPRPPSPLDSYKKFPSSLDLSQDYYNLRQLYLERTKLMGLEIDFLREYSRLLRERKRVEELEAGYREDKRARDKEDKKARYKEDDIRGATYRRMEKEIREKIDEEIIRERIIVKEIRRYLKESRERLEELEKSDLPKELKERLRDELMEKVYRAVWRYHNGEEAEGIF
jgi:hypothetical protein